MSESRRALLSVYDKSGVVDLARGLTDIGWELISSGGTARVIADAGIPVTDVAQHTGSPIMLGHRVVTLHPKVHGGILADRTDPEHQADMAEHDIDPIERMVVDHRPQMIALGVLEPLAVGPLDHHPLQRARLEACAVGRGDGAGKGARTGTVLGDNKAIGLPCLSPPCIDGVAHNCAEERPDFRGGDEIAAPARLTTGGVEPLRLVVQGRVNKIGHGDGPVGRDARSESIGQRCGRHEISRRGRRPTA
ncbi:MAG: hypothetical protein EBY44_02105 [Actinobacteria bacterium]|nr:hypothetical protein [Actinomycetota bacterium]